MSSQWLFPVSAVLDSTPSRTTSSITVERELYDRARGVEFLFRLGVSLQLPSSAMHTAATWFHRFYMRFSMEDYHRQDVAAACIFLATKTEECGRKLRDVAKIYCSKVNRVKVEDISDNSSEVEESQSAILQTEEVLLEALCFDFVVTSPHSDLVDLFDACAEKPDVEEYAWTIANDSFRTPLCVLYPSRIIAAACYILAQQYAEGPSSLSLAARIASPAPSASLPTPPSHKANYPESTRFALDFFKFNEVELVSLSDALVILLEFYAAQDTSGSAEYIAPLAMIQPPNAGVTRRKLFTSFLVMAQNTQSTQNQPVPQTMEAEKVEEPNKSPSQPEGESNPSKSPSKGWKPVTSDTGVSERPEEGETTPS